MSKEAMKLWLEALNVAEHFVEEYAASKYYFAHIAAKTSLEEALAKQEQEVDWKDMYEKEKRRSAMWIAKYEKDIGPLEYAVPAKQEQGEPKKKWEGQIDNDEFFKSLKQEQGEPVGVIGMDVSRPHMRSLDGQYFGQKPDTKTVMLFKDLEVGTKLYTTPQQRTWVGLTDDDRKNIHAMWVETDELTDEQDVVDFVEKLLKEKNT